MKTEVVLATAEHALRYAADVLRNNGVVAFPTDTVYGVGALVQRAEAVERLYSVKGRSNDKAIAVLVAQAADLREVAASLTPAAQRLAEAFWPGPLTLVVLKHPGLPAAVSSLPTVGVRLPDHPVARRLLELTGPLAVTSANRSGEPNTVTAQAVLAQLDGRLELVVDGGRISGGVPSTVVDCTGPELRLLRAGPITEADLQRVLGTQAG
jgi:L-threonylcarbamoyladenylate synthase